MANSEMQNYALLVMRLGLNNNGEWSMDFEKAKQFWFNLSEVLPDNFGSILSPMDVQKITLSPPPLLSATK